jgi:hypothetical protein
MPLAFLPKYCGFRDSGGIRRQTEDAKILTLYLNFLTSFLILDGEAIGTAATPGLLCQPRVIMKMIVEK